MTCLRCGTRRRDHQMRGHAFVLWQLEPWQYLEPFCSSKNGPDDHLRWTGCGERVRPGESYRDHVRVAHERDHREDAVDYAAWAAGLLQADE